ncbi:unannotated protein [freshwater metagenome]|uniref:Unannotated protein n=1 Tax=freshwater metagenome TaxID=449393 RepID=A0A6J7LFT8_9ZZZZ
MSSVSCINFTTPSPRRRPAPPSCARLPSQPFSSERASPGPLRACWPTASRYPTQMGSRIGSPDRRSSFRPPAITTTGWLRSCRWSCGLGRQSPRVDSCRSRRGSPIATGSLPITSACSSLLPLSSFNSRSRSFLDGPATPSSSIQMTCPCSTISASRCRPPVSRSEPPTLSCSTCLAAGHAGHWPTNSSSRRFSLPQGSRWFISRTPRGSSRSACSRTPASLPGRTAQVCRTSSSHARAPSSLN